MPRQLVFSLSGPVPGVAETLLLTPGISLAVEVLAGRAASPARVVCLHGPAGSGKSLLLQRWAAGQGNEAVLVLDNLDTLSAAQQEQAFHTYNRLLAEPGDTLIILTASRAPVAELNLLPDLKSRLLLGLQIEVSPPGTADLARLALKWAAERQVVLPPEVITFLLNRAERSAPALQALINQLDALSLEQRRAVTIPLARQVLAD